MKRVKKIDPGIDMCYHLFALVSGAHEPNETLFRAHLDQQNTLWHLDKTRKIVKMSIDMYNTHRQKHARVSAQGVRQGRELRSQSKRERGGRERQREKRERAPHEHTKIDRTWYSVMVSKSKSVW